MTAEATKAKEITVTFNKPITDASKVKATVKKGSADRACKATVDGSKIILAMDAKLIKGTYTVTVEGVADTAMTADVLVEKDEELTSYKVSSVATMKRYRDPSDSNKLKVATNSAIVTYQALNQYGERMNADKPQISCTLGTVLERDISESKVNADGSFVITDMPSVMAIQGQKGNVIVVDKKNGVNTTQEVTVSAAATPTEIEIVGVYDANSNKIDECLKENADLRSGNYYILLTAKDQYTNDFTNDVYFKELTTVTIAGGLTNVKVKPDGNDEQISKRTVNGKDYIAIQLTNADPNPNKNKAKAGSYTLMIVNQEKGMLLNASYSVAEATIIKSISITADKGLYNGAGEQELSYDIIDQNGNAVTSYAILNDSDLISFTHNNGSFKFIKNADGSAKLVYTPSPYTFTDNNNDKEYKLLTESVTLNNNTSNLMVQPLTLTLYEGKVAKSVSKLKDGTATSLALNDTLKISLADIVYADQYGNEMSAKDAGLSTKTGFSNGVAYLPVSSGGITCDYGTDADVDKLVFTSYGNNTATATVYLKLGNNVSTTNYDCKFDVVATDTKGIDASTLKIDSINGGNAYHVAAGSAVGFDGSNYNTNKRSYLRDIKVVGKIGGVDTVIPDTQYVIKSLKDNKISTDEVNGIGGAKKTTTKTATVVVQVTTQDANGTRTETELTGTFVISTDGAKIAKINDKADPHTTDGSYVLNATNRLVTAGALKAAFTYKDQYGADYDYNPSDSNKIAGAGDVLVTVDISELESGKTANDCVIVGSGTSNVNVTFAKTGTYKLSVKVFMKDADGKVTSEKDRVVTVRVN